MTKNELIQYLRAFDQAQSKCYHSQEDVSKLEREIANLKKEPELEKPIGVGEGIGIFLVCWIVSTVIVTIVMTIMVIIELFAAHGDGGIVVNFLSYAEDHMQLARVHPVLFFLLTGITIAAAVSLILAFIGIATHNKNYPDRNAAKMKEYQSKCNNIPALEAQLQKSYSTLKAANNYLNVLRARNIVHSKWENKIGYLLEYLEEGRADTLKEAMNLWETECAQLRMEVENERYHRQMQQQAAEHAAAMQEQASRAADASERAADAAEDAAFWERASTFITADSLDKIRKDINQK